LGFGLSTKAIDDGDGNIMSCEKFEECCRHNCVSFSSLWFVAEDLVTMVVSRIW